MKIQVSLCEGATMNKTGRAIPFSTFRPILLLSVFLLLRPASPMIRAQAPQEVKVIQIDAKKYEFSGSPLRIEKGTKVELKVTATDREHGVKLSVLPDGADPKTPRASSSPRPRNAGRSRRAKPPQSTSSRKPPAPIPSSVAWIAAWATIA
jgi:hypothetical protein